MAIGAHAKHISAWHLQQMHHMTPTAQLKVEHNCCKCRRTRMHDHILPSSEARHQLSVATTPAPSHRQLKLTDMSSKATAGKRHSTQMQHTRSHRCSRHSCGRKCRQQQCSAAPPTRLWRSAILAAVSTQCVCSSSLTQRTGSAGGRYQQKQVTKASNNVHRATHQKYMAKNMC